MSHFSMGRLKVWHQLKARINLGGLGSRYSLRDLLVAVRVG